MGMAETSKFPEVQGGGSLIIAWQIKNKRVVVVGGGEVCVTAPASLRSVLYLTRIPESRSPRAASSTASMPTPR